jgi:hypothetical protein
MDFEFLGRGDRHVSAPQFEGFSSCAFFVTVLLISLLSSSPRIPKISSEL